MSNLSFSTANMTFRQLIGNGAIYKIPSFQRDFSWTQDQWEELWEDIQETLKIPGETHYLGYLVLQTKDNRSFDVIDGQQRLTTLSILTLGILKNLNQLIDSGVEPVNNKIRIDQIRNSYIGYLDPVTLVARSKLSLNRHDDHYYQTYLAPLSTNLPLRNTLPSQKSLKKVYEWFIKAISDLPEAKQGAKLAELLEKIADTLFFTVITVSDELNAYKVFETLNSRGVRLSPTDLLKNYLFSLVSSHEVNSHEMENMERRWHKLGDQLGEENFTQFIRVHWNSRRDQVRESELFKKVRIAVNDRNTAFELMRDMEEDVDVYAALSKPEDLIWNETQKEYLREIKMFQVTQPFPLLMAAKRKMPPDDFTTLLRVCSVISFRYNVIGSLSANEQEKAYHSAARKVSQGELANLNDVIRSLSSIYVTDNNFEHSFSTKSLRSTTRNDTISKYILCKLEKRAHDDAIDFNSRSVTLEHILPQNPNDEWSEFTDGEYEDNVYRLGNYALLEDAKNREAGNQVFEQKSKIYASSQFGLTRKVGTDNVTWNPSRINVRQTWMAKQAKTIWRIDQIGK